MKIISLDERLLQGSLHTGTEEKILQTIENLHRQVLNWEKEDVGSDSVAMIAEMIKSIHGIVTMTLSSEKSLQEGFINAKSETKND